MNECYFYDGKSASRHDVILSLSISGFTLRSESGDRLAYWTLADCTITGEDPKHDSVRLSNDKHPGARLVVEGPEALKLSNAVKRATRDKRRFRAIHLLFALPMAMVIGLIVFALYGPPLADKVLGYVPHAFDHRIGELVFDELKNELMFCDDQEGQAALAKIVDRLNKASNSPFEFKVAVAASGEVNAFALPGGRIVFLDGLIKEAQTPEEVAGVLAHEMSHVIKRHGVSGLLKQLGLQFLLFAGTGDTNSVINFGSTLVEMSMSRTQEAEADLVGADILARAKISVSGLRSFFTRIEEKNDLPSFIELVSTHPHGDKRANALQDPPGFKGTRLLTTKEWNALKNMCPVYDDDEDNEDDDEVDA